MYTHPALFLAVPITRPIVAFSFAFLMFGLTTFGQDLNAQIYILSEDEWVHRCANSICQECAPISRIPVGDEANATQSVRGRGPGDIIIIQGNLIDPIVIERLRNHGVKVVVCHPAYKDREYYRRRKFIEDLAVVMIASHPTKAKPIERARDWQLRLISLKFFRAFQGNLNAI